MITLTFTYLGMFALTYLGIIALIYARSIGSACRSRKEIPRQPRAVEEPVENPYDYLFDERYNPVDTK